MSSSNQAANSELEVQLEVERQRAQKAPLRVGWGVGDGDSRGSVFHLANGEPMGTPMSLAYHVLSSLLTLKTVRLLNQSRFTF